MQKNLTTMITTMSKLESSQYQFLSIGSKKSRRVGFWNDVLQKEKHHHQLINYNSVERSQFPPITQASVLRITSPGEDASLQKRLYEIGGFSFEEEYEPFRIYPKSFWYSGWCYWLQKIETWIAAHPFLKVMNTPKAIRLAFHKLECQQFLQSKRISIPKIIVQKLTGYEDLLSQLHQGNIHQVFIKPYHGSSASGVMAFRQMGGKQILYTTIDLKSNRLYNSLRLKKYTNPVKIKTIINTMALGGLMVEEFMVKVLILE